MRASGQALAQQQVLDEIDLTVGPRNFLLDHLDTGCVFFDLVLAFAQPGAELVGLLGQLGDGLVFFGQLLLQLFDLFAAVLLCAGFGLALALELGPGLLELGGGLVAFGFQPGDGLGVLLAQADDFGLVLLGALFGG